MVINWEFLKSLKEILPGPSDINPLKENILNLVYVTVCTKQAYCIASLQIRCTFLMSFIVTDPQLCCD